MTIETQQFPVAAIRRIVIVVVVLMMDRQLTKSLAHEFTPAPRTDPRENPEGSLPIGLLPTFSVAASFSNDLVLLVALCLYLLR
jgi:hypothetical protein